VFDCISGFSGIDDARTLYCKLLTIPIEDWSKFAKGFIIDGKIIAGKSDFRVLYFTLRKLRTNERPKPLPDRAEIDSVIFDELDLIEEERKEVYWIVCELVKQRLEKARSLKR